MEQWADEGEKPCGGRYSKERLSEANYRNTGKQEGQRTSTRILRFGPTGKVRCPEERGREVGGEVEDGAKSFNPKEVGENSGRTNRVRHKGRGFGRSDYRRRDNELKRCLEGLRACTSVL